MLSPSICFSISTGLMPFRNLWSKDLGQIAKNKFVEMELLLDDELIGFNLDLGFRGWDHAGPSLSVSLLFLTFSAKIYDGRHWDHDKECWQEGPGKPNPYYEVEIYTLPDEGRGQTVCVEVQAPSPNYALVEAISDFRELDEGEHFTHISVSGPREEKKVR